MSSTEKTYTLSPEMGYSGTVTWKRVKGSGPVRYGDVYQVNLTGCDEPVNGPVARMIVAGASRWQFLSNGQVSTFLGTTERAAVSVATLAIENYRHRANQEA